MADERMGVPEQEARNIWAWTELFRTFQVALDPKKLLLAGAGIVVMWLGWLILSWIFINSRAEPKWPSDFPTANYRRDGMTEEQAAELARHDYDRKLARYALLYRLAGKGDPDAPEEWKRYPGKFVVEPWHEDRGPNPFLLATGQLGRPWPAQQFFDWFTTKQMPVLLEPLVKFLRPIVLLIRPDAGGWNRIYLLLITLWTLMTWALFGGAITRLAAVQLAGKDRPGLVESLRFVIARYVSYLSAPLVPLVFIALIVVLSVLYGFLHLIPFLGDVLDGVAWPIMLLLGFGQAVLLVGLVGYPLMYATLSTEGSDTFDALSRSYNYVFQAPWNYIWYGLVAVVYGAILVFFVCFMGSLVVYLTKWSLSQTPGTEYFVTRRVENLFRYAPTSFEWRHLLGGDVPQTDVTWAWYNQISATLVSLWVVLVFLLVIGFGYSYFFSAGTMIYLLLRRKVDETEMDEVYLEEEEPDEPLLPPTPPATAPSTGQPLQMVEAPALRTPANAPASSETAPSPPPPAETPAGGNGSPG
jgi:hypothetical protein